MTSHEYTPTNPGHEHARQQLEGFITNPGLDEMAELFGVSELPQDSRERLNALQQLAAAHWDFRKGAERQAVDWNDELIDKEGSEQWNTIFAAASQLDMVESSRPHNRHPDYLAILGGANKAPLDRLRYGMESVEDFKHVVYLGSSRPVSDVEREKAREYAPNAVTEFDLGCGAFETLLNARMVDEISEVRNGDTWGMRLYEFEHNSETKSGFVLSTPQEIHVDHDTKHRATTYDNYQFFADRAELARYPETTVVGVTTGFYVPGQHLPAVQMLTLPYGVETETIGHDAAYSGVVRKPSQLLQETKSAIDAAVRLQNALNS